MSAAYLLYMASLLLFCAGLGCLLVWAAQRGKWWLSALAVLLVSPVVQAVVGTVIEHRSLLDIFNPATASWLFLFGHSIALPVVAAASAFGWRGLDRGKPHWYTSWLWYLVCVLAGVAVALWYRPEQMVVFAEGGAYNSPTKLAHDFGDLPVLVATLLCVAVPVLVGALRRNAPRTLRWSAVAIVAAMTLWGGIKTYDEARHIDLKPLHPAWEWSQMLTK